MTDMPGPETRTIADLVNAALERSESLINADPEANGNVAEFLFELDSEDLVEVKAEQFAAVRAEVAGEDGFGLDRDELVRTLLNGAGIVFVARAKDSDIFEDGVSADDLVTFVAYTPAKDDHSLIIIEMTYIPSPEFDDDMFVNEVSASSFTVELRPDEIAANASQQLHGNAYDGFGDEADEEIVLAILANLFVLHRNLLDGQPGFIRLTSSELPPPVIQ